MDRLDQIAIDFKRHVPDCDYWTLRLVAQESDQLAVRQGVVEPSTLSSSVGAMVTVVDGCGVGYGATSDLSARGLRAAADQALAWARIHGELGVFDAALFPRSEVQGDYVGEELQSWDAVSVKDKVGLLRQVDAALDVDERIVDRYSWLSYRWVRQLQITAAGGRAAQQQFFVNPGLAAIANQGNQTQRRHGGGSDWPGQGGFERILQLGFSGAARQVAEEAIALLDAPECPEGRMDLVLTPSQMMLQIHESIGHPLELDRILGDERNYAGTSFVTPDMFGTYRYGSELLNVTFDPTVDRELASYAVDDEGTHAKRCHLIRNGVLERPLGGSLSQARSHLPGVANARACSWDRPPIDRMANINLEPGDSTMAQLVARVERGVLMDTNRSWSIDDSRNKFQFGCELGHLIEDGELKGLVRNPGYRGVSAEFWRSLDGVGNRASMEVRGVSNCGKGEPNQVVYVGHASPPCLFRNISVFGGGE